MAVKPRPDFQSISELLKQQLSGLAQGKIKNTVTLDQQWKSIVGDAVAQNAKVLFVRNGILHVGVSNSAWLQELSFMRDRILTGIQDVLPDVPVTEIKFKMLG